MITIWNQREVFIGNPSKELKFITDTLSKNRIKYKCRIFSNDSVHFLNSKILSLDFLNIKNDTSRIYYVYVHKKDLDKAFIALQQD